MNKYFLCNENTVTENSGKSKLFLSVKKFYSKGLEQIFIVKKPI
jgi:hypothetical protein